MASPYGSMFDFGGTVASNAMGYDTGTRKFDMQPGITLLAPTKTPLLQMFNRDSPRLETATPNWLNDTLEAPEDNTGAIADGAEWSFGDEAVSTRTQNVVRTFEKTAKVTEITEAEQHYGNTSERAHQMKLKFMAYKRDHEWALINSTIAMTTESSATRYRGILESISNAGNNTSTAEALDEDNFKTSILKPIYDDGADPTDVFAGYTQHAVIDAFTGNATKYVDVTNKEVIDYINVYDSLLGRVNLHMLRDIYLASSTVFALDREYWEYRWLIPTYSQQVPRTGHWWASVITGTACLIDRNGKAGASHTNLT